MDGVKSNGQISGNHAVDIRTVQDLMGHNSIKTTMVYLHILHPGGWKGVESPLDNVPVENVIHS